MDRIYDLYIFELVNRINFEKAMRTCKGGMVGYAITRKGVG